MAEQKMSRTALTAMVVGGLLVKAAQRLRETVEWTTGAPFADSYVTYAQEHGAIRMDQRFEVSANGSIRHRAVKPRVM